MNRERESTCDTDKIIQGRSSIFGASIILPRTCTSTEYDREGTCVQSTCLVDAVSTHIASHDYCADPHCILCVRCLRRHRYLILVKSIMRRRCIVGTMACAGISTILCTLLQSSRCLEAHNAKDGVAVEMDAVQSSERGESRPP